MDEMKLNHAPHVGPEPVKAKPNHDREKTYRPPNVPGDVRGEQAKLPENTAQKKVVEDMGKATDEVRKRL